MREFWNPEITAKSYDLLLDLNKKFDFVLIGGWAIYLHTRGYKSKDIDFIIDYDNLRLLQNEYRMTKNDRLKKYEIKTDFCDVDVYIPYYSQLSYPEDQGLSNYLVIDNIKVIPPEALLILKQGAETDRRGTIKGKKDALDIALLLFHGNVNLKIYFSLLLDNLKLHFRNELITQLGRIDPKDVDYLNIGFKEFIDARKEIIEEIKSLRLRSVHSISSASIDALCDYCGKDLNDPSYHKWYTEAGERKFYCLTEK